VCLSIYVCCLCVCRACVCVNPRPCSQDRLTVKPGEAGKRALDLDGDHCSQVQYARAHPPHDHSRAHTAFRFLQDRLTVKPGEAGKRALDLDGDDRVHALFAGTSIVAANQAANQVFTRTWFIDIDIDSDISLSIYFYLNVYIDIYTWAIHRGRKPSRKPGAQCVSEPRT